MLQRSLISAYPLVGPRLMPGPTEVFGSGLLPQWLLPCMHSCGVCCLRSAPAKVTVLFPSMSLVWICSTQVEFSVSGLFWPRSLIQSFLLWHLPSYACFCPGHWLSSDSANVPGLDLLLFQWSSSFQACSSLGPWLSLAPVKFTVSGLLRPRLLAQWVFKI